MLSPVKIWRNQKKLASLISKTGRIVSWTVVRVPPCEYSDQAPYPVAVIELENKKRITAQLVDWTNGDLHFGREVVTVIRRTTQPSAEGLISYSIKAKPVW